MVVSVLSGNRNFEGRINSEVRANYLMSPPLVVAYALAGRIDLDITQDPLGKGKDGKPVYLRDIWPTQKEVQDAVSQAINSGMFTKNYKTIFDGDRSGRSCRSRKAKHICGTATPPTSSARHISTTCRRVPRRSRRSRERACWRSWATA